MGNKSKCNICGFQLKDVDGTNICLNCGILISNQNIEKDESDNKKEASYIG